MVYNKRIKKIFFYVFFVFIGFNIYSNSFYNSLVEDLLNCCSYGYKGINLESGEIDFSNNVNTNSFIISNNNSSFYIPSMNGFFKVKTSDDKIFYTRNGDFIKRGEDYYLSFGDYKLATIIKDYDKESEAKKTLIYHPKDNSSIIRNGCLFFFSDVDCYEEEIIPNRLELPNTDPIRILLKMKAVLKDFQGDYNVQLDIINCMLNTLIEDKMHEYYIQRSFSQFDLEKYQLLNNTTSLDQLRFIYSTNWVRTFSDYIQMLYIE